MRTGSSSSYMLLVHVASPLRGCGVDRQQAGVQGGSEP